MFHINRDNTFKMTSALGILEYIRDITIAKSFQCEVN